MKQIFAKGAPMGLVFILALIVVVETGLLIGGFIYYETASNLEDNQVLMKNSGKAETKKTATISAQPVLEGWKTYSSLEPYTFNYPQKMTLKEDRDGKTAVLTLKGALQKENTEMTDGLSLSFSKAFSLTGKPLKTYVEAQLAKQVTQGMTTVKPLSGVDINGLKGFTFTVKGTGTSVYTYLQSQMGTDNYVETISTVADPNGGGYQMMTDSVLATLKFTK